jgi:transcriptional regulator with XRE-family HTH domain
MFKIYRSYSFRDKDPVIDQLRTLVGNASYQEISDASGVSTSTLYNWFYGATRRPTYAATAAVASACGYDFVLQRKTGGKVVKFTPRVHRIKSRKTA